MFKFWWVEALDKANNKKYSDRVFAFIDGTAGEVYKRYLCRTYHCSNDLVVEVSPYIGQDKIVNNDFKRI
jgi:hypothetical protein